MCIKAIGLGGPILKDKLWFYISGGTGQNNTEKKAVHLRIICAHE